MTTTLKDVARHAGVSSATASLVLNERKSNVRISEETRERVIQAARDLNYSPNRAARALPYKMVAFPVNQKAANIAAPDLLVMFKDSKNKEAVMKFIEFQYRDDIRKGFVQGRGIIPDTYSLMEDPELASPVWDAFQSVAPDSIPQPITPTTNRLMEEVMKMGQAVFLGQGTPQEEIDALAETMQSLSKP